MFDERLKTAYEKSNLVLQKLGPDFKDPISTGKIIEIIEELCDCKVITTQCSFGRISDKIRDYGAMMSTFVNDNGKRIAQVILNEDKDPEFQRFSLIHEMGHIITHEPSDLFKSDKRYVVSSHINYRVSSISPNKYETDPFLLNEQLANVFALRLLMPKDLFYRKVKDIDSISKVAKYFGLTDEAVISRIMLVE